MVEGLLHIYSRIRDIDPDAVVQVCAAGRASSYLATLAAILGFNVRIGMEDTIWKWPHKDDLITNNAEQFRRFKMLCQILGREIATPNDYRRAIGLPLR
jgi:3-keto-5-aminohexanoate cleavage enzyme